MAGLRRLAWRAGVAVVALAALAVLGAALLPLRSESGPPRVSPVAAADLGAADGTAPILVLVSDDAPNPFGRYLAEILRAEGINGFRVADWPAVSTLDGFDAVLLAEGAAGEAQADRLRAYVAQGGLLIGMRPGESLARLFGVEREGGVSAEGSLRVERGHPLAKGIDPGPLRYHGEADHYRTAGAEIVARLAGDSEAAAGRPAVTVHRRGRGAAVLWAYDLARSVAYARQGNPAWAGEERDGLEGIRESDMFFGWIDLERMATAQADEQQRLLANVLSAFRRAARPVPRLWYFPRNAGAVLVATGDAHASPASAIEDVLDRAERRGGHMSVYYAPPRPGFLWRAARRLRRWAAGLPWIGSLMANPSAHPSPSQVASWRARGHEFALHPFAEAGFDLATDWRSFTGLGYGPVPPTMRTHRALWSGWVDTAREQASAGIRMNLDSYQVGPAFRGATGEWALGYFNGSGLPMRFVDEDGRVLRIYQQSTQLVDEHWLAVPWGGQAMLDAEEAIAVSRRLLRNAVERAPAAVGAQFHVDSFARPGPYRDEAARWLDGTLEAAASLRVPIVSAAEWLRFTETRHDAGLRSIVWDASSARMSFHVTVEPTAEVGLTLMVPLRHGGSRLAGVEIDGARREVAERTVGALEYGCVVLPAGSHDVAATWSANGVRGTVWEDVEQLPHAVPRPPLASRAPTVY